MRSVVSAPGAPSGWLRTAVAVLVAVGAIVRVQLYPGKVTPQLLILGVLGIAGVLIASKRPLISLTLLIIYLPLQQPILAYLYGHGLPAVIARNLGFVKELIVAGVVLAAFQTGLRAPWRAKRSDFIALAFLGMGVLYLLAPLVVPGPFGTEPFSVLIAAFRLNFLFIILFLACRRLTWSRDDLEVLGIAVLVPALAMTVAALWEYYANASFGRFIVNTLKVPTYRREILGLHVPNTFISVRSALGATSSLRVGGWFLDPLNLGFFMILPVAIALRRQVRARATVVGWIVMGLVAVTLVVTLTRSSILGGVVACTLIVGTVAHYQLPSRVKFVALAVAAAVFLAPVVGTTDLVGRLTGALNGKDPSSQEHGKSTSQAFLQLAKEPFGRGLGSNPVTARLANTSTGVVSENAYIQVGRELGVISMVLFIFLVISVQSDLMQLVRATTPSGIATAVWAAGWGLALNGLFLHVWLSLPVALTFWSIAGAASAQRPSEPHSPSPKTRETISS